MLVPACAKRDVNTSAPGDAPADDLAALAQQLATREAQLRSFGVGNLGAAQTADDSSLHKKAGGAEEAGPAPTSAPPQAAPVHPAEPAHEAAAGADADFNNTAPSSEKTEARGGRCMQVCEISAAICGLQDQICGLVPRHRDDPRYQATCDRAVADCRLSTEACHGCSEP